MKVKWRLYVDIYDTLSRKDLPSVDLSHGIITKPDEIKEVFEKIDELLPKDAYYFKAPATTLKTKSLTLESPLCYSPIGVTAAQNEENKKFSPAVAFEPEGDSPTIQDLQSWIEEYLKNFTPGD
jgi:hypothetical protein